MIWEMSHRAEEKAREIADRHYNRQKVGSPQFVPPGRCLVLYAETDTGKAFWVTSWPFAEYAFHAWAGAWVCSAFRNEGAGTASDLIRQAVAATRAYWGAPPELGMVTFIDRRRVRPIKVRGQPTWGAPTNWPAFAPLGRPRRTSCWRYNCCQTRCRSPNTPKMGSWNCCKARKPVDFLGRIALDERQGNCAHQKGNTDDPFQTRC